MSAGYADFLYSLLAEETVSETEVSSVPFPVVIARRNVSASGEIEVKRIKKSALLPATVSTILP